MFEDNEVKNLIKLEAVSLAKNTAIRVRVSNMLGFSVYSDFKIAECSVKECYFQEKPKKSNDKPIAGIVIGVIAAVIVICVILGVVIKRFILIINLKTYENMGTIINYYLFLGNIIYKYLVYRNVLTSRIQAVYTDMNEF